MYLANSFCAGFPVIYYHIKAASKIPNLNEVLLLGFDDPKQYEEFIAQMQKEFNVTLRCVKAHYTRCFTQLSAWTAILILPFRYLKETHAMGTAGGLYVFRNEIMAGNPSHIFVLNCDICCAFPLQQMLSFHVEHGKDITVLGKKVWPQCIAITTAITPPHLASHYPPASHHYFTTSPQYHHHNHTPSHRHHNHHHIITTTIITSHRSHEL